MTKLDIYGFCMAHTQADRWLRLQINQALKTTTKLTMMEWLLLLSVNRKAEAGLSVTEAAESLGVSLPQITALVRHLVNHKVVVQRVVAQDRRGRRLYVLPAGKALCKSTVRTVADKLQEYLKTSDELKTYLATLKSAVRGTG